MTVKQLRDYFNETHYGDDDEVYFRVYEKHPTQIVEYPIENIIYDDEDPNIVFLTSYE